MPTGLIENPLEVEEESREVSKPVAKTEAREEVVAPAPKKSLARRIFEGHEDFLGCTPD